MEEAQSVTGLVGYVGGVAFISALVAAAEGSCINVGIGYGKNSGMAVVCSVAGTTAGFTVDEARKMAGSLEGGLEQCPGLPIRETIEELIVALRHCADKIEGMGVMQ